MRSARQSAIRLLQLMMVASVVLPLVLFAFAAWLNYRHEYAVADDRIERSLDILHERVKRIVDALPEVRAIFLINRDGQPLVSSRLTQIPADFICASEASSPR